MKKNVLSLSLFLLLISCSSNKTPMNAARYIDSLSQSLWDRDLATGRAVAVAGGKSVLPDHLYAGTQQEMQEDAIYFSDLIKQLQRIDTTSLSDSKKTDYDLLLWTATTRLDGTRFYDNIFPPVTPYAGYIYGLETIFKQASFEEPADGDKYLKLLNEFGTVQQSYLNKLRRMESKGLRLAKPQIQMTLGLIKSWQVAPEQHFLYPTAARLKKWTVADQQKLQQEAGKILQEKILPQQDSLANFLKGTYLIKASDKVGLAQYPGGKEYYRYLVRYFTTADRTPEEMFALGQQQVSLISQQIDSIRLATGFKGDRKAFYTFLQKDKQFLASTPEEVERRLREPLKKIEAVLGKLISLRPATGYDIRRLSPALEPVITFGNYEAPAGDEPLGVYYYNGSKLDQRPLTSVVGLALHEITPGHHLQGRLQAENKALSVFRQNQFIWAFSEGWASYASQLGLELGSYNNPYDYCGRLLMDMFVSVRLVVDAGMNYMGWSREQAMDYMREYVIESEEQIKTETIRYGCDIPGQALSYKSGALEFERLRKKYRSVAGNQWDDVKFHDFILSNGCLPFAVLEKAFDREYKSMKKNE